MEVTVGVSNRHVHLTKNDLAILFGEDYELEKLKDINQPGQFASTSLLTIKSDKNEIKDVRVLGPLRDYTQVEISKTDAYFLKINPPIRESGFLEGSSPITLVGAKGKIDLKEGCIIADRHIHILPRQVELYGFKDTEKVNVFIPGEKGGIITNVYLRISENSYFELHLDTDDANSHLLKSGDVVTILKK